MPSELKLSNPAAARAFLAANPLGEVNGLDSEAVGLELAPGQSFAGEAITASVRTGFSIRAFNSPDDEDEDGVIGEGTRPTPIDDLRPQLTVDADSAYLKYRGQVALKATAAATTLRSLGFAFEGETELVLTDYRRHARTAPTRDAVLDDVKAMRCSLRLSDVLALSEREAVAHQLAASVSATVEIAWADVVSGSMGALANLLGSRAPLGIDCAANATLSATVSFADDFILVFSRQGRDAWRIGLRKARTRSLHVGLALNVVVAVDPQHFQDLVDRTFAGLLGEAPPVVQKVLAKANVDKLKGAERALVDKLVTRLGLESAGESLQHVRDAVDRIQHGLHVALDVAIREKVRASFTYDYRRILQKTTILQCLVTQAGLTAHHAALVKGQFGDLLREAASASTAVRLEHFLYQRTLRTERSWGFSLWLGKFGFGSTDRKSLERVEQFNEDKTLRRNAYLGERSYRDGKSEMPLWSVAFSADMPAFTNDAVPRVSEYDLALSLVWHEEKTKLDQKTLARWVDQAVLWGAVDERHQASVLERCRDGLKARAECVIQLTAPHVVFEVLLAAMSDGRAATLAPALAAAMPWSADDSAGRRVSERRRVFSPLWLEYLQADRPVAGRELARHAATHLRKEGAVGLANREWMYEQKSQSVSFADPTSFGGLVDLNSQTRERCQSFMLGLQRLQQKRLSGAFDAHVIPEVFEQLEDLWTQSLHVRAVGAHLIDVARSAQVASRLNRSFTLRTGIGGSRVVVFTA